MWGLIKYHSMMVDRNEVPFKLVHQDQEYIEYKMKDFFTELNNSITYARSLKPSTKILFSILKEKLLIKKNFRKLLTHHITKVKMVESMV